MYPQHPPPPPRDNNVALAIGMVALAVVCGGAIIASALVSRDAPPPPQAAPAPPEDASIEERIARLPERERRDFYVGVRMILDTSITRAVATGTAREYATYVTPRCSPAWLRRFAVTRFRDGPTTAQWLREHSFAGILCARGLRDSDERHGLPLNEGPAAGW